MPDWLSLEELAGAAIYSVLGIVLFSIGFALLEKITPFSLKKELVEDQNTAIGVLLGSCALALGIIIAAAIVG